MRILQQRFSDGLYRTGIICIAISLFFFCLAQWNKQDDMDGFGMFIMNFGVTVFYFFYRLTQRKKIPAGNKIHTLFLLLILSLISAYALNRTIPIFASSVDWFSVLLSLLC